MKALDQTLIFTCTELLMEKQLTIAFAESATAGRISCEFSLAPDAGKFLKGGLICYDAKLKETLLGVPSQQIETFTPESQMVTRGITLGLQQLIPADIHVGCTGLTTAGGSETAEKPVGTMFLCAARGKHLLFEKKLFYAGNQEDIILGLIEDLARLLTRHLKSGEAQ